MRALRFVARLALGLAAGYVLGRVVFIHTYGSGVAALLTMFVVTTAAMRMTATPTPSTP